PPGTAGPDLLRQRGTAFAPGHGARRGLHGSGPGRCGGMSRDRLRVAFIGAGSTVFARVLLKDLMALQDIPPLEIRLMDIDPERLRVTAAVARELAAAAAQGAPGGGDAAGRAGRGGAARPPARIVTTLDRREALDGADYVVCLVQIGGYRPGTVTDFEIPKRYGIVQTIADTLGIGGIMRGLRTIPFLQELARDMRELCPDAWLFNYANPLAINQWALEDAGVKTVGLCHSVRRTARQLAEYLGVPFAALEYQAAGINHMAFFLDLWAEGRDLYPALRAMAAEGRIPAHDRVRFEILAHFGYFVSESSFHFAEYVPYFLRPDRPGAIEHYQLPVDEYLRRCQVYEEQYNALRDAVDRGGLLPQDHRESDEDVANIIHSLETGQGRVIHANVRNGGAIENLPPDCIVEVPCRVDRF